MRSAPLLVAALLLLSGGGPGGEARAAEPLNIEAAKSHFGAGKSYYDERRWEDALREFKEAYRLSRRPALLYNIALCNERLLRYEEAVEVLKNYLRIDPGAEDRLGVEKRITELEIAIRNTKPGEPPPPLPSRDPGLAGQAEAPPLPPEVGLPQRERAPAATAPSTPAPPRRRLATWIVGGAGLALMAAGAGSAIASHLDYQTLTDQCGPSRDKCPAGYEDVRDRGQTLAWVGGALLAAGGASMVTAVVLYFLEGRPKPDAPHVTVVPMIPAGGGAGVSGAIEF